MKSTRTELRAPQALLLAALLAACAAPPPQPTLEQSYERAVQTAALLAVSRTPPDLSLLPAGTRVTLATFTEWGKPPSPTQRPVWVSQPNQLRPFCANKPDPVLAIQQALGLPPKAAPDPGHTWQVITFEAPRTALFRPCLGGTDIAAARCEDRVGDAQHLSPADANFLREQIRTSQRAHGYPFTAMGWSYNWDPAAPTPIGISEYVLRPGTPIDIVDAHEPAKFCATAKP